jgi:chorismate-pyruvate lyase
MPLALLASGCAPNPLLADFRHTLDSHDSATIALEQWCERRGMMTPAHVQALAQDDAGAVPISPAIRKALGVGADEPLRARHVLLVCGGTVLSDARNWYVPARLTPAMNQALETTRVPFGKVVASLGLHRVPQPIAWSANVTRAPTWPSVRRIFRGCYLIRIKDIAPQS